MYSQSFIYSLKRLNLNLKEVMTEIFHMDTNTASQKLDLILQDMTNYATLFSEIDFTLPESPPDDFELVSYCLNLLQQEVSLKIQNLSKSRQKSVRKSDLIEVKDGYILAPLSNKGNRAFTWLPLLEILENLLEGITANLSQLVSRARTDCDDFLVHVWVALYHASKLLAMDVSIMHQTKRNMAEANKYTKFEYP